MISVQAIETRARVHVRVAHRRAAAVRPVGVDAPAAGFTTSRAESNGASSTLSDALIALQCFCSQQRHRLAEAATLDDEMDEEEKSETRKQKADPKINLWDLRLVHSDSEILLSETVLGICLFP